MFLKENTDRKKYCNKGTHTEYEVVFSMKFILDWIFVAPRESSIEFTSLRLLVHGRKWKCMGSTFRGSRLIWSGCQMGKKPTVKKNSLVQQLLKYFINGLCESASRNCRTSFTSSLWYELFLCFILPHGYTSPQLIVLASLAIAS